MNGHKKSILLIILLSFNLSCKLSKNSETEPNNTFSNANKIEINKETSGYLETDNDIDYYSLSIDEEQILKIELSAIKGVNTSISIYKNENPKPVLIKIIDDNRKSAPETFKNLYVQQGQYFFSITHGNRDLKKGNTETPYRLLITSRSFLDEEKEPNDNPYSANKIMDQSIIRGYFSPGQNSLNNDPKDKMKEIDWYKFNINITENIPALIDIKLTGVSGVDSVLTILNNQMNEIITIDSAGTGEGESIADFGIKESGLYYILVSSKNFLLNYETPYELKLVYKIYDQNFELESNNSFDKANIISNNLINGKINGLADKDFYQYIPSFKNNHYKAGCSGSEGTDIVMTIYDSNRNRLFEINNSGPGGPELVPYFLVKNSIYISVSALSLTAADPQYTLSLEQYDSNDTLEVEPNNSKTAANPIDQKITGFITYKNDTDFYLIEYDKRHKVKITVKGVKEGKIRISTTDPLGFIIKSKEVTSDEEISFTEIFDKKGFIIVEPITANFEYPYTLSIEDL